MKKSKDFLLVCVFLMVHGYSALAQDKNNNRQQAIEFTNKGIESYANEDMDMAIRMFDNAVMKDSAYEEAYYRRGNAYFDKKDFLKAGLDYLWLVNHHTLIADVYEKAGQIDTSRLR